MDLEKALQWFITCLSNIFIFGHFGLIYVQLDMTNIHKHTLAWEGEGDGVS